MSHNLVWYDIPAIDLDRAIAFYSAVLGAPVEKEPDGDPPIAWLPTPDGGRMGCLCVVPDFKPSANGVMVYFGVNGRLHEAVAAVRAHGGTVQTDIHSLGPYGFRAEVLDSEGNGIALHSDTEAWDLEIARRVEKVRRGEAQGRPADEVFRDIRAQFE